MFTITRQFVARFFVVLPIVVLAAVQMIFFLLICSGKIQVSFLSITCFVVALTGTAVFVVMYLYNKMVKPLELAKDVLNNYAVSQEIPKMPVSAGSEANKLLNNIHATITQLDALNVEKSDMIDLLSHDLRSPVGRILSLSNLIKYDTDGDVALYNRYIAIECNGLLRMLENILVMLREDNHILAMSSVNLEKIVKETISFFELSLTEKNISLNIDIDPGIYVYVQSDLFTQALRNLLSNAIKFSPDGKTIHIAGKNHLEKIFISIRDEGIGMKPDDIGRIFDRFTKAGKKGTNGESSIGLGLYLSKKIIEKHAGMLMAESEGVGKGACFTIVLQQLITKKPDKILSKEIFKPTFLQVNNTKPIYNKSHLQG